MLRCGKFLLALAIVIAVPAAGQYYIGRDLMQGRDKLIEKIKLHMDNLKPSDSRIVYIKGGVNVPYGEIVNVVDAIREAGFDQIGLVAEKKKESEE